MTTARLSEEAALRDIQDLLVAKAEELVRGLSSDNEETGKTQLSRAIEVASTADTLRVFINWLRYQAGRERSRDFWTQTSRNDTTLAEAVAKSLDLIRKELSKRCENISDKTIMRATTLFLGYMRRAVVGSEFLSSIALS